MDEFTQGEWEVFEGIAAPAVIIKGKLTRPDRIIAICRLEHGSEGMAEATANARLIAAAPEMYEALKLYIKHQEGKRGHYCSECHNEIDKALAKAKGKE